MAFEKCPTKHKIIPSIAVLAAAAAMTAAAEILNEREIIFPEITAIAIGALLAPKQTWNASPIRILLSVAAMSFAGFAIVRFVPLGREITLPLGFAVALISLIVSKTGFVPQLSACVLPIVLGSDTLVYPISAALMTGIILLLQLLFDKTGLHERREFIPEQYDGKRLLFYLCQFLIVTVFFEAALFAKQMYFVVPPLIVGYIETVQPKSKLRKRPFTAIALVGAAALLGTAARLILTERFGVPLVIAAVCAVIGLLILLEKIGLYFPPCGAICTLPMLLEADGLVFYPLEVTLGFSIMTAVAFVFSSPKINRNFWG